MPKVALTLALVVAWLAASSVVGRAEERGVERFELENGLRVLVRPVLGVEDVCVLVLFEVGEAHDPAGRSGISHLIEHLHVTSAAGDAVRARTAEEMMAAYPGRWNAQTGRDYTVFAFVEPKERLAEAVREAAARMADLRITEDELGRERARLLDELMNMWVNMPALQVHGEAARLVAPLPHPGRKGGIPAQVQQLSLEDVRAWHQRYYQPRNAHLVLAGAVEATAARALVADAFARLAPGEAPPTVAERASEPERDASTSRTHDLPPGDLGLVCLAYRAPTPNEPAWAPFLVAVARLQREAARLAPLTPSFAPLDDPAVLYLTAPLDRRGGPSFRAAEIRRSLTEVLARPTGLADQALAKRAHAFLLGTLPLPDATLGANLYGLAFGLARRGQWHLDPEALARAIDAVTDADLRSLADTYFARGQGGVAAVLPR